MKILVIDNYDSFTYNLVQYLQELGARTVVYRNDEVSVEQARKKRIDKIVISPGPGRPESAGISCALIKEMYSHIPILGVCLGHQCIGQVFGGEIVKSGKIMHGKTSQVFHHGRGLFHGIPSPFTATRYHSLVISRNNFPVNLTVTARTKDDTIMGVKEKTNPLFGVQFHPESILTGEGKTLLNNFLKI
ncbi:MAG: anthranilate/aminodeoxychorismate synthase component II [Candidatus Omnitrophica bacterium]|nr:anthranilate/aminodeoxychorismate synthase component II [Candidatus Omnitrophota bacterium]